MTVMSSGHTRLPVVDGNRVVGLLHTKEFLALKESDFRSWNPIIRNALQVYPTHSALGTMRLMQEKRSHMAIVLSPVGEKITLASTESTSVCVL